MLPQEKSLRIKAAIVGGCMEASAWLLWFWAPYAWPEHPEDSIQMWGFYITQFPSIILAYLLVVPFTRFIGYAALNVIALGATSIAQAFLFAVYAYIMLYRPEKKSKQKVANG